MTVTLALSGDEDSKKSANEFLKQLSNDPGRVIEAILNQTPEQREKLAQAYERGDAYEIGKVGGEILANMPTPIGGGVGTIGKIGKAGKIAEEVAGAAKAGKLEVNVARAAGEAGEVYVIGRQVDTAIAKDWPGHKILDVPSSEWTLAKNDAWIQEIIDKRAPVYIGSPQTTATLWDSVNNRATVFSRELEQLRSAGYTQVGDYMIPPTR